MNNQEKINFINKQNPKSRLDIIRIENVPKIQIQKHSSFRFHSLKFYAIFIVNKGEGKHFINFNEYECIPGTMLLIGNGHVHKFMEGSDLIGYLILFHDDFLANFLNEKETIKIFQLFNLSLQNPKIQFYGEDISEISGIIEDMNKEYFDVNDNFSNKILAGQLYTLLLKVYRKVSSYDNDRLDGKYTEKFMKFQELLRGKIFSTSKVSDYAILLGVSTKTLNSITKSMFGKQAKDYINEYYILCIKRILADRKLSIKECAYQSGFDDVSNFYKFFKKYLKVTPEQFRQKYY